MEWKWSFFSTDSETLSLHLVKGNSCFTNRFAWCIELVNTLKAELLQGCHCFWRISPWSPTCFFGMWINSAHDFFTLCHDVFRFRLLPLIESLFFCGTWAVGFRFLEGAPPKKKWSPPPTCLLRQWAVGPKQPKIALWWLFPWGLFVYSFLHPPACWAESFGLASHCQGAKTGSCEELLMVQKSWRSPVEVGSCPSTHHRWLALGFLNHQQFLRDFFCEKRSGLLVHISPGLRNRNRLQLAVSAKYLLVNVCIYHWKEENIIEYNTYSFI